MSKPSIFIGSSSEKGLEIAREIRQQLDDVAEVRIWNEGVFGLSHGTLEDLVAAPHHFDFAILVMTTDDLATTRGETQGVPRDNVVFELGLFMGHLGRERTFIVYDKSDAPKLPSDLAGVGRAEFDKNRQDGSLLAAVGVASDKIRRSIRALGHKVVVAPRETLGRDHIRIEYPLDSNRRVELTRAENERSVQVENAVIRITHGRIEEHASLDGETAIVLPANEFFDDACIGDARSALGAFMQKQFGADRIGEIRRLIDQALEGKPVKDVQKSGRLVPSYGIGTCVWLDRPLESPHRIILTSVTTDRDEGIRADISSLFASLDGVVRTMGTNRMSRVALPLIGSGHGCLTADVSLFAIVLALAELAQSSRGRHIRDVQVVIFRDSPEAKPQLSFETAERILVNAAGIVG